MKKTQSFLFLLFLGLSSTFAQENIKKLAGTVFTNTKTGILMIWTGGGTFQMGNEDGDADEKPIHTVTVRNFAIGQTEVTNAQYCKFLNIKGNQKEHGFTWLDITDSDCKIIKINNEYLPKDNFENHPVVELTWYGAAAYCKWSGGRLPTEAEWEFVAKGGALIESTPNYKYAGSDSINDVAWNDQNSVTKEDSIDDTSFSDINNIGDINWSNDNNLSSSTHPIAEKKQNALGLFDMSGNVWEWCNDWFSDSYYKQGIQDNPQGVPSASKRSDRGGSWFDLPSYCQVSYRNSWIPTNSGFNVGFRLVVTQ